MMVIQILKFVLDWVTALEDYFSWYNLSDNRCFRYASLKLTGPVKVYWKLV